ncbi:MAG: hypothetical protein M1497_01405 [Nitrospirae bacterium]|nr:hypothetical protein [Nitrospirota bacterium]
MKKMVVFTLMVAVLFFSSMVQAEDFGMFVKVMDKFQGTFEEAVKGAEQALARNGWQILASYDASVPEGCSHKAHTIVISSPTYGGKIMSHGARSAFSLPLRVGIFTDENGISLSFVNPASLNRTVLGDNVEKDLSVGTMRDLSALLASAGKGRVVNQQAGEVRSKGHVGGMGGGAFTDKIEEVYKREDSGNALREITGKVREGITSNTNGWKLVYTLDLGSDVTVYGVNKAVTEAKAFRIAGEKRESKVNSCPGVDHVSAFPIEVVVYKEKGMVRVMLLDEMYRMKVYFEDAGKWAFMKNMGMPGAIEREITAMVTSKLK